MDDTGDWTLRVTVTPEAMERRAGRPLSAEDRLAWLDANGDLIYRSALHKIRANPFANPRNMTLGKGELV